MEGLGSQGREDWLLQIGEMTGRELGDGEGLEDWNVKGSGGVEIGVLKEEQGDGD